MPTQPNVYALRRDDIAGALAFIEQHWDNLRPEDFAIIRQLQTHPAEYLRRLSVLEKRRSPSRALRRR